MTPPTPELLATAPWMRYALAELGTAETRGDGNTARVIEYLNACKGPRRMLQRDSTAWCSAFANWCMTRTGIAGTGSLGARSWLRWGDAIEQREVRFGDVVVFWRGAPIPASVINAPGHVGFVERIVGDQVLVLGGNQGDKVSIAPNPLRRVLGFRRCKADALQLHDLLSGDA